MTIHRMGVALIVAIASAPGPVLAACNILPKPGMTTSEVYVSVARPDGWDGPASVYVAWPTTNPDDPCCLRAKFDERLWRGILDQQISRGVVSLSEFVSPIVPPGGDLSDADRAQCAIMFDRLLPPVQHVIRNTNRPDGARPLKRIRDETQPYNSVSNPLIDLKINGVPQYVEAGRPCERIVIAESAPGQNWRYVMNAVNIRGIALCK